MATPRSDEKTHRILVEVCVDSVESALAFVPRFFPPMPRALIVDGRSDAGQSEAALTDWNYAEI